MDHDLRAPRPHLCRDRRIATRYDAIHHRPRSLETRVATDAARSSRIRRTPSGRIVTRVLSHSRKSQIPSSKLQRSSKIQTPIAYYRPTKSARHFGFSRAELRKLRALKTPAGVQRFLDELPYNLSYTARSPKKVLHERTASCLEGAIFAAAALRVLGFPPLIFDLEAEQDTDHVVALFKVRGHWAAVAKSNFPGCRYREPVHRTLRELAMTYFNVYFNLRGERTLRRYSRPVNLARFDRLD